MKIYIAGRISNRPIEETRQQFAKTEQLLTEAGHEVVNPLNLPHDHDKSWESYMRECIPVLLACDCVYLQNGWHLSRGAKMEMRIAEALKITTMYEETDRKNDDD